jgi:hypothetical protein
MPEPQYFFPGRCTLFGETVPGVIDIDDRFAFRSKEGDIRVINLYELEIDYGWTELQAVPDQEALTDALAF